MTIQKMLVAINQNAYPIYIGKRLLANHELLFRHVEGNQVMVITNQTVAPLYLSQLTSAFKNKQCDTLILPDGEAFKMLEQVSHIFDALIEKHHHRDTTLVALGGGVIGDMTGFAAACYQRGVAFLQVPTTLLSQVDASIGGKTAVNHRLGKNMIGAFHQPNAVIIDIDTLATLPERECRAGIAEIIKTALIKDATFFDYLEKNLSKLLHRDPAVIISMIKRACEIKRDIVIKDEKEQHGERILLNLGHTFAHAIEQVLGYGTWLHGEAVSAGVVLAAKLSCQKGWIKENDVKRIENLLKSLSLPTDLPETVNNDALMLAMQVDKKVINNQLQFVLLKAIGEAVVVTDVTDGELRVSLQSSNGTIQGSSDLA